MTGIELIAAERQRQIIAEKWTPEHDDGHTNSDLALAAVCYAVPSTLRPNIAPKFWPDWNGSWWKPTPGDRVRELVKAGALIVAEIDRLQRINDPRTHVGKLGLPENYVPCPKCGGRVFIPTACGVCLTCNLTVYADGRYEDGRYEPHQTAVEHRLPESAAANEQMQSLRETLDAGECEHVFQSGPTVQDRCFKCGWSPPGGAR